MQFGSRFKNLIFSTSVRFTTKTLAYLAYNAYKAFMVFKRSRLNPFQKYRSITSFSMDWLRTIRPVYASASILSVCTIKLQVIVTQNRRTSIAKTTTPEQIHMRRPCPCMTTSIVKDDKKTKAVTGRSSNLRKSEVCQRCKILYN